MSEQQVVSYVDVELRSEGPTRVNTRQFVGLKAIGLCGLAGSVAPGVQTNDGATGVELLAWTPTADNRTIHVDGTGYTAVAALPSPEPLSITQTRLSGAVVTLMLDTSENGLAGFPSCTDPEVQLFLMRAGQPLITLQQSDVTSVSPGGITIRSELVADVLSAGQDLTAWQLLCTAPTRLTTVFAWLNAGLARTSSDVQWNFDTTTCTAKLSGGKVRAGGLAQQLGMKDNTATPGGMQLTVSPGQQTNMAVVADVVCSLLSGTASPTQPISFQVTFRYNNHVIHLPKGAATNDQIAAFVTKQLQAVHSSLRLNFVNDGFEFSCTRAFSLSVQTPACSAVLGFRMATHAGRTWYRSSYPVLNHESSGFGVSVSATPDPAGHLTLHAEPATDFPAIVEVTQSQIFLHKQAPFDVVPVLAGELLFTDSGWMRVLTVALDGSSCQVEGHGLADGPVYARRAVGTAKCVKITGTEATQALGMSPGLLELEGVHPLNLAQAAAPQPTYAIIMKAVHGLTGLSGQVDRNTEDGHVQPYVNGVALAVFTPNMMTLMPFSCQPVPITRDLSEIELFVQSSEGQADKPYDLQGSRVTLRLMFVCA